MNAKSSRSNEEWLSALKSSGAEQAAAISDLRAYVLRAALYSLRRNRGSLRSLGSTEINQLAEDCAQEAVLAILRHLDEFRGESRFTTWAYSFAVNTALVAARRERWKRVPLDTVLDSPDLGEWTAGEGRTSGDPQRATLEKEVLAVVREAIDHQLTNRQRQALKAVIFEGVPLDELVRHWGSNRNAVYKLLHDARRKLKAHLAERGFGLQGGLVPAYVDLEIAGRLAETPLPRLGQHLDQCSACREEYETLRDFVRLEAESRLPSIDELRHSF